MPTVSIDEMENQVGQNNNNSDDYDFDHFLAYYYQRLFPYKEMIDWLSYGNVEKDYFLNREFSFTLKDDIYTRYRSFNDLESFAKELKRVNPHKIDIGAIYTTSPRNRESVGKAFLPKEKELVFDIDMTDYDDIRTCCSGANICNKCWVFMTVSVKVIHEVLTKDFGFQNLLWVYSGRRGVHCWVCDSSARKLSPEARKAIAEYITVISGGEGKSRKVNFGNRLHPALQRAYDKILEPTFENEILIEQNLLTDEIQQAKLLDLVPFDPKTKEELFKEWDKLESNPTKMWKTLRTFIQRDKDVNKNPRMRDINPVHDIVFTYSYPRLDVHVSTGLNHLLKSPFCVHPKTGRICVPFNPETCDQFDPFTVPTLEKVIKQMNQSDLESRQNSQTKEKGLKDYKKTDMKEYVGIFKEIFLRPLQVSIKKENRIKEETNVKREVVVDF